MSDKFTIDDLPAYSPWPARLLGIEQWGRGKRSSEDTWREYQLDKWNPLLEKVRADATINSIEEADRLFFQTPDASLRSIGDSLELLTADSAQTRYFDLVLETLKRFAPLESIVEFGAGYGSIILRLAKHPDLSKTQFFAGEYTQAGVDLITLLATRQNTPVYSGRCELGAGIITSLPIRPGAIIYTSYSACYKTEIESNFIEGLVALQPKVVVHFEPIYEHCINHTVTDFMRKRYIEVNGYNQNLKRILDEGQANGHIRILEERPKVIGLNPLLPASVIIWSPM